MRKNLIFLFIFCSVILMAQEKNPSQTENFDFKTVNARIEILPSNGTVSGKVNYKFQILAQQDTLYIDGRKMQFTDVILNGSPVNFTSDEKGIYILSDFLPSENNSLQLNYTAEPKSGMYFINWEFSELADVHKEVWTQGQGKYTSNWLPSFDDIEEKAEFDLSFEFPSEFQLVSNGKLKSSRESQRFS